MYVDVACQCIISLWRVSVVRLYFHSYHWICNAIFKEAPNKSQIEKDEEAKRHHQAMATWTTQREKNLFEQYIKPTLTPLNGIENERKTLQTLHKTLHFLCISLIFRVLHYVWFEAKILHKTYIKPYMGTKSQRD